MSDVMDEEQIKRWTARRKSALVLEIIQGKTTVAQASRQFDLTPAEIESWVGDGKRGMENALRAKPEDVREQYERQLKDLQEAYGEAMLELRAAGQGRGLMLTIQQGLREDGFEVSMVTLCRWFGVTRRSVYYRSTKDAPKVKPELAEPIRELIEAEPSFGYRTVAALLM
jgi:transposase-like protein